jgi:hypothetical protein
VPEDMVSMAQMKLIGLNMNELEEVNMNYQEFGHKAKTNKRSYH